MDIKSLIPQREPIIMVDGVTSHSSKKTVSSLKITESNIFVEDSILQSSGLIEHMAQSAAVRMGLENRKKGDPPLLGYIASVRNMIVNAFPKVGDTIQTEVIITNQINNIIIVKAESRTENIVISACELRVFIAD